MVEAIHRVNACNLRQLGINVMCILAHLHACHVRRFMLFPSMWTSRTHVIPHACENQPVSVKETAHGDINRTRKVVM
jgi:hypothetical protein